MKHQKMLADVMRNPKFGYVFSFLIGVGLIIIVLGKDCTPQGDGSKSCRIMKAPAPEEVKKATYLIGSDCYKFKTITVKCPQNETVVESFKQQMW